MVFAAAAYLLVQLLVRLRFVVLPVIGSLLLVILLQPPAERLKRWGWPPAAAAISVLLGGLLILAAVLYFIVSRVAQQFGISRPGSAGRSTSSMPGSSTVCCTFRISRSGTSFIGIGLAVPAVAVTAAAVGTWRGAADASSPPAAAPQEVRGGDGSRWRC